MTRLKRLITPLCSVLLFLFLTSTFVSAQSYEFHPEYNEGETWVVDYQSDFSTRFRVKAQGRIVDKKKLELIDSRKYSKTFHKVKENRPTKIEHFYVRANRKKQPKNKEVQMKEQGAKVTFQWNTDQERYEIASTSHELSEETRNRLVAREIYRHFLPDEPVNLGSEPWQPDVENPVDLLVSLKGEEQGNVLTPEFSNFKCELADVKEENGRKIATISIQLSTSEAEQASADKVDTRLEGHVKYDLDRQKPVEFDITSRPAGISFERKIEDTIVHVENMGIRLLIKYDTSSENGE